MESSIRSVSSVEKIKRGFHESSATKRYVGVQQTKSGRWRAVVKIKKIRYKLGTYDTPEEASTAVMAKKLEFAERRNAAASNESPPSLPEKRRRKVVRRKMPTNCLLFGQPNAVYGNRDGTKYPEEIERVLGLIPSIKRYKGVWRKKSGVWVSKIRDPLKNVRVCLGVFETDEEALNAYYSKKLEFESQVVGKESVQESLNSAIEMKDSDEKVLVHDEGGLFWGKIPYESIIDNHGFLLGEFSCVDDLRICID